MHRYNIFNQIHKGLRALLCETAIDIQHADFWNTEEAAQVIDRIREVIRLFEKHAASEDTYIFSAINAWEPSVADAFEKEHVRDHELGEKLAAALEAYEAAPVITKKAEAAPRIQSAFMQFMAFNLDHMAREEEVINPLLWRYYSDEQLRQVTGQIISHIPADYMARYSKWMIRGVNNAELAAWLREVELTAPEPVFRGLFAMAEQELGAHRFRQVLETMSGGAMVA